VRAISLSAGERKIMNHFVAFDFRNGNGSFHRILRPTSFRGCNSWPMS
jgi:hypothetical protein